MGFQLISHSTNKAHWLAVIRFIFQARFIGVMSFAGMFIFPLKTQPISKRTIGHVCRQHIHDVAVVIVRCSLFISRRNEMENVRHNNVIVVLHTYRTSFTCFSYKRTPTDTNNNMHTYVLIIELDAQSYFVYAHFLITWKITRNTCIDLSENVGRGGECDRDKPRKCMRWTCTTI